MLLVVVLRPRAAAYVATRRRAAAYVATRPRAVVLRRG